MWVFKAIALYGAAVLWRLTRASVFGRILIRALASGNENLRTLAGMCLVRSGHLAEPVLEEALHRRQNLPLVMILLADIGDRRVEPEIRDFSRHEDPRVAEAAARALRVLTAQRQQSH